MNLKHKGLLFAIAFPFLALVALTGYKAYKRFAGVELTIPITGFDPRDLLSGHYLIYRLDIEEGICEGERGDVDPAFLCVLQDGDGLATRAVDSADPSTSGDCTAVIKGRCDGSRFVAGVERFYIPEEHSRLLDRVVRGWGEGGNRAKLVISVDKNGSAVVKNLLIDNQPWRDFLAKTNDSPVDDH